MSLANLKERHLDRMIAEELEASPVFAKWVVSQAVGKGLPQREPKHCETVISYYRQSGETDIRAEIRWPTGETAVLHIEDKLGAVPQPRQAERYAEAANEETATFAASLLVAPSAWLRRHPQESRIYDATLSLEAIANWLKLRAAELAEAEIPLASELQQRLLWRANILSGQNVRQAVYREASAATDLNLWNEQAAAIIEAYNGLQLRIYPRQRSSGRTKPSRFMTFLDQLAPFKGELATELVLKTRNAKRPGRVSLQIKKFVNDGRLLQSAQAHGFSVEPLTAADTQLITHTMPALSRLDVMQPAGEQIPAIEAAAEAAQRLTEWWANYHLA